jgi:hypothetical protein
MSPMIGPRDESELPLEIWPPRKDRGRNVKKAPETGKESERRHESRLEPAGRSS